MAPEILFHHLALMRHRIIAKACGTAPAFQVLLGRHPFDHAPHIDTAGLVLLRSRLSRAKPKQIGARHVRGGFARRNEQNRSDKEPRLYHLCKFDYHPRGANGGIETSFPGDTVYQQQA